MQTFSYTIQPINDTFSITFEDETFFHLVGENKDKNEGHTSLFKSILHPEDKRRVFRHFERISAGRNVNPLEFRIATKSDQLFWFYSVITKLDKDQKSNHNGILINITDLKLAEETVQKSEGKVQSITQDVLESSPLGISILDQDLNIVWINRSYETFFRIHREEVLGKNAGTFLLEHSMKLFENPLLFYRKILDSYNNNTYIEKFECHLTKEANSEDQWLEHWSKPIETGLYAGGRIEFYSDITEYKNMIQESAENEARFKQLLNHLTDYIFNVKIEDGKPAQTFHGPGCLAVTGYTQDELHENPELWIQMVVEGDRQEVEAQATAAILGQSVKPIEHRITHKEGSIRWVRNTIAQRRNENGEIISYDGLITDITDLKEAENLAAAQHQQLIQADKMATLGILVSGVAHEINNPNNFIMINANIVARVWKDTQQILNAYYEQNGEFALAGMPYSTSCDKIGELIDGLGKGARRIENIVSSLKDFTKPDMDNLKGNVDIKRMIETSTLIVNNLIKKSTRYFQLNIEENLPRIKGNFQKLEQVIINLITNSCQALPDPEKKLSITASYHEDKEIIQIIIQDEGAGISEEAMKHIVDPFFTTKRDAGGTGLGLSIAYNIIQDHGGEMCFDSMEGEGTTVTLHLPVSKKNISEETSG